MSYLLVGNPSAQSGKNAERIVQARALLDGASLGHAFLATVPAGGTVAVVRDALRDPAIDVVIAMGGDGTFAEVAKGLLASGRAEKVRMAMLPTGTANDQGKSFGLMATPDALARNVDVIREGLETRLDVGRIAVLDDHARVFREDHFFDSAGVGISPRVLALRNEDRKQIEAIPLVRDIFRDHIVYAGAFFRTFAESYVQDQKFDVRVVVDGEPQEWKGLTDLVVKATRVYGGMWVFDPTSRHDDGLFEVVPFVGKRDWMSKAIVALDPTGGLAEGLAEIGVTHSTHVRGEHIELDLHAHDGNLSAQPLFAQIDGEELPLPACEHPKIRIQVLARVLRLVVPREHAS